MSHYNPFRQDTRTRENTAFITGPAQLEAGQMAPALTRLKYIVEELYNGGVCFFLVGGEPGFDMLAAEYLIRFRDNPPRKKIMVYSVLPCRGWNASWPDCLQHRQERILRLSDRVICVSKEFTEDRGRRNEIMINSSAHCISLCNKKNERVAELVKEALECGVVIHNASSFDVRQLGRGGIRESVPRYCRT